MCRWEKMIMLKIKKGLFSFTNFFWIKDDRDSVTRPKSGNIEKIEKWKNWIRLEMCFFLSLSSNFCAHFGDKAWFIMHFKHDISFHISRIMHACIICIARHQVRYLMPNLFPIFKKYGRPFGSSDQRHKKYSRRI